MSKQNIKNSMNTENSDYEITSNLNDRDEVQNTPRKKPIKKQVNKKSSQNTNMVRRSTLYICVCIALFAGVYMGTFLQNFQKNASIVTSSGSPTSMLETLEAEAKNNPQNANTFIQLGNAYYDANNPQKAIEAYEAALKITPNNPNVITDCGTMYRRIKNFDKALELYYTAQKFDPKHQNSFFNAGIVLYYDLGRKEEGKKMFEEVLKINPNAIAPNGQALKNMMQSL